MVNDLFLRFIGEPLQGRSWENRGEDGLHLEKKLLIDFLYAKSGGHLTYVGRYMLTTHKDMEIVKKDRVSFPNHLKATLDHFQVTEKEINKVFGFIENLKV